MRRKPFRQLLALILALITAFQLLPLNAMAENHSDTQIPTEDLVEEETAQILEEIEELTVDGSRTEQFGLMILSVNGIRAEYTKDHAYWAVLLNGEPSSYGISRQPVQDGEHYQLVYTPAE